MTRRGGGEEAIFPPLISLQHYLPLPLPHIRPRLRSDLTPQGGVTFVMSELTRGLSMRSKRLVCSAVRAAVMSYVAVDPPPLAPPPPLLPPLLPPLRPRLPLHPNAR